MEVLILIVGFLAGASARSRKLHEEAWDEFLKREVRDKRAMRMKLPSEESMVWIDRWQEEGTLPPGYRIGIDPEGNEVILRPGQIIPELYSYPAWILQPKIRWIDIDTEVEQWPGRSIIRSKLLADAGTSRANVPSVTGRLLVGGTEIRRHYPRTFSLYAATHPTFSRTLRDIATGHVHLNRLRPYSLLFTARQMLEKAGVIPMSIKDDWSTGEEYLVSVAPTFDLRDGSTINSENLLAFRDKIFAFLDHGFILAHSESFPNEWFIVHPLPPKAYPWGHYPYDGISPAIMTPTYVRSSGYNQIWQERDEEAKRLFRRQFGDVFDIAAHQRGEL